MNMQEEFENYLGYKPEFEYGEYVETIPQNRWEDFQAAWRTRGEHDAKICKKLKVSKHPFDRDRMSSIQLCIDSIRNDKE